MKPKIASTIMALLLLGTTPWLVSKNGCMDNSMHLKQKYDTKTYHYVSCNCPCDYYRTQGLYASAKHKCLECGHRHDPRTTLILGAIPQARVTTVVPTVKGALDRLLSRWKAEKNAPAV